MKEKVFVILWISAASRQLQSQSTGLLDSLADAVPPSPCVTTPYLLCACLPIAESTLIPQRDGLRRPSAINVLARNKRLTIFPGGCRKSLVTGITTREKVLVNL